MEILAAHRSQHSVVGRLMVVTAQIVGLVGALTVTRVYAAPDALAAPITGNAFRDYNANGIRDTASGPNAAIDVGVRGVKVTAYDLNNAQVGVASTDADGNYALTPGDSGAGPYRIEFGLPVGFSDGPSGKYSSVQFVAGGGSANLGIVAPGDYCQSDPLIAANCYTFGYQLDPGEPFTDSNNNQHYDVGEPFVDLNKNGQWNRYANAHAIIKFPASHSEKLDGKDTLLPESMVPPPQVGTTYGLGWQSDRKQLYAGAFLKRHTGFGPNGTGAIYRIDTKVTPAGVALFADLNAIFGANTAGADPHPGADLFADVASLNKIGKVALGDVDVSADNRTVYAMNLADKTVYALPTFPAVPNAQNIKKFAVPISTITNCPADEVRPFGLGAAIDGSLFVGGVCSAEASQKKESVRAYVWRLNPTENTWSTLIDVQLTSVRPFWKAWKDVENVGSYVQPMLSDIVVDGNDLVLGFRDRYSDQVPEAGKKIEEAPYARGYGDTLRACAGVLPGTWDLESKAHCGSITTAGLTLGDADPTFKYPEYYFEEYASDKGLDESSNGGLAQLPGLPYVMSTAYDPVVWDAAGNWRFNRFNEFGVQRYDHKTGKTVGSFAAYQPASLADGTFGKAGGMGDLEALCDAGPIEIGNRVWIDENGDGLQGANEPPVPGVQVQLLYADGTPVKDAAGATAIATTNSSGEYYFQNDARLPSRADASLIYIPSNPDAAADQGLVPYTGYQIKLDVTQAALSLYELTGPNASNDSRNTIDSDGELDAAHASATINITTSATGVNNHTYDFGFRAGVSLGNRVWFDHNNDGFDNDGELGTRGAGVANVELWLFLDKNGDNQVDLNERVLTTTTDADGLYNFSGLAPGGYYVSIPEQNFKSGAPLFEYQNSTPVFDDTDAASDPNARNHGAALGTLNKDGAGLVTSKRVNLSAGSEPAADIDGTDGSGNQTIDFGFYKVGLGNFVWEDSNNNGVRDSAELPIPNVAVRLCSPDGNSVLQQTATNAAGEYAFTNLLAGTPYVVGVTLPSTPAGTLPYQSSRDLASSADPATNINNDDNGVVLGNSACGNVRSNPITLNPSNAGATGSSSVFSPTASTNDPTIDFGLFRPARLGNYVWFDIEESGEDGSADPDENGVNDVRVTLLYSDGNNYVPYPFGPNDITTTNGSDGRAGFYQFNDLVAGDYRVVFVAPIYWAFTAQNSAADNEDSDPDESGLVTDIQLIPGQINDTVDAGIWVPLSIGNRVFIDNNNDGIDNDGPLDANGNRVLGSSPGIDGIDVRVYYDLNSTDQMDDGDRYIDARTTEAGGYYTVGNNISGTFMVQMPSVNFDLGGPLQYCMNSTGNGSPVTDAGLDMDDDGTPAGPLGWVSRPITLTPFQEPLNDGDTSPNSNNTDFSVDFGCVPLASLGNRVWLDANNNGVQDGAETTGVAGALVTLLDGATNTPVLSTTTDGDGFYTFTQLMTGSYAVQFDLPPGYVRSPANNEAAPSSDALDSDANQATGRTVPTTLDIGENDLSWDAGLSPIAGLGDRVWHDFDRNGLQDAGESGLPNVTVTLRVNGAVIATQQTDANGFYWFDGLTPATQYEVCVVAPADYQFTLQDTGANAFNTYDSDADPITGCLPPRAVAVGESYPNHDAGLWQFASLGNYTWIDINRDGLQSAGERVLADVTVDLYQNGVVLSSTQTAADGHYLFSGLLPGSYSLTFGTANGYARTHAGVLGNGRDAVDSDAGIREFDITKAGGTIGDMTESTVLQSGENDMTWDTGYVPLAALGDYVWDDRNHNGLQEPNEPPVAGVTVTLLDKDGLPVATQQTNDQGLYLFDRLQPSEYTVIFSLPAGYAFTRPSDGSALERDSNVDPLTGQTERIIFLPGQTRPDIDAGVWQPASLGDYTWEDVGHDGQQDESEPGVNNVQVTLLDTLGTVLAEQPSAAQLSGSGYYSFTDLVPGSYVVSFTAPSGFLFTKPTLGADESNSDAQPIGILMPVGPTRAYALTAGQSVPTVDAGLVRCASVGNRVWLDANLNGQQDANETGALPSMTVKLLDADNNALVAEISTDASGNYDFPCVPPGKYIIASTPPDEHDWTQSRAGGNSLIDNDIDSATGRTTIINLEAGEKNPNIDLGLILKADLGNFVWEDRNFNGRQDEGEPVVPGVTVTLYSNGEPIGTQVTNQNGKYGFTGIRPRVAYTLSFALPDRYVWTTQQAPAIADEANSDVSRAEHSTFPIVLEPGDKNMTIDAGIFLPAALGDYIWEDVNGNGLQDPEELGVNDVVVTLLDTQGNSVDSVRSTTFMGKDGYYTFTNVISGSYVVSFSIPAELPYFFTLPNAGDDVKNSDAVAITRTASVAVSRVYTVNAGDDIPTVDAGVVRPSGLGNRVWLDANSNGVQDANEKTPIPNTVIALFDATTGLFVVSTTTDISGSYAITGLLPGGYCVRFGWPAGYATTIANEGLDDALDSNVSPNTGCALTVLGPAENDPTIDGGANVEAQLGDTVWFDLDRDGIQDANAAEHGLAGVTVTLRFGTRIVTNTVTTANGYYTFPSLLPLVPYTVNFARLQDTHWTHQDAGKGLDLIDSDVSIDGQTRPVFLQPHEANPTIDAGVQSTLKLDEYPSTSGVNGLIGEDKCVTYTLIVTNTSLVPISNIVITDVIPEGTTFDRGNVTLLPGTSNTVVWSVGTLQASQRASNYFVVCAVVANIEALDNVAVLQGGALPGIIDVNGSEVLYNPTAITLARFEVSRLSGGDVAKVKVMWETSLEQDTYGFHLWRSETTNYAEAIRVSDDLIAARGRNGGAQYEFTDTHAQAGAAYHYWLAETELSGKVNLYGPVTFDTATTTTVNVATVGAVGMIMGGGQPIPHQMIASTAQWIEQINEHTPALHALFDGPIAAVKIEPVAPDPKIAAASAPVALVAEQANATAAVLATQPAAPLAAVTNTPLGVSAKAAMVENAKPSAQQSADVPNVAMNTTAGVAALTVQTVGADEHSLKWVAVLLVMIGVLVLGMTLLHIARRRKHMPTQT